MADWSALARRLDLATGSDPALDRDLADSLGRDGAAYTASAERAREWVLAALPGWHLHVGFDASGVFPYAAVSRDAVHLEATAPTVPLAVLRAALKALEQREGR